MPIEITERAVRCGPHLYHRGLAYRIRLGSYGLRMDPVGPQVWLAPDGAVGARQVIGSGIVARKYDLDWDTISHAEMGVFGALGVLACGGSI